MPTPYGPRSVNITGSGALVVVVGASVDGTVASVVVGVAVVVVGAAVVVVAVVSSVFPPPQPAAMSARAARTKRVRIPRWSPQRRTIRKMDAAERALAYAEIRQLAAAYAFFTDAKDIDALVELYVPDVRISSTLSGRDRLHQLMTDALRTVGVTFLNIGTHHIVLADDGESATGVVYCKAEIQDGGPDSERWINHAIQYHDVYERRDGRWYFGANRKHFLVYGAELEHNPLDQPDADWPARQTGRGTHPQALASWQAFFAD